MNTKPALCSGAIVLQLFGSSVLAAGEDEQIVCEVSDVNFAWGYYHLGVFIDSEGSIFEFNYGHDDTRWLANRSEKLTADDLREKYRPGQRRIGKVCPDQVIWMRDKVNAVRYGSMSPPEPTGISDIGTKSTQCFAVNKDPGKSQGIELRIDGSFKSHNLANGADELANWIEAVAAEARSRVHLPPKSVGCIAYPASLTSTPDQWLVQSKESREQAIQILRTAEGLRCQLNDGQVWYVEGTNFRQHPATGYYDTLFDHLDFEKGTGRMVGTDNVLKVKPSVGPAGIVIEDEDLARNSTSRVTTVVPYKMGGQNRFPAITNSIMPTEVGVIVTQHIGSCTVIPRA